MLCTSGTWKSQFTPIYQSINQSSLFPNPGNVEEGLPTSLESSVQSGWIGVLHLVRVVEFKEASRTAGPGLLCTKYFKVATSINDRSIGRYQSIAHRSERTDIHMDLAYIHASYIITRWHNELRVMQIMSSSLRARHEPFTDLKLSAKVVFNCPIQPAQTSLATQTRDTQSDKQNARNAPRLSDSFFCSLASVRRRLGKIKQKK